VALIEARGLRKTYSGDGVDVRALDGVDLDVGAGESVAIMGPSGSGKSTLLHVLGAIDTADEGSVMLDGRNLAGLGRADLADVRRESVGIVFQFFNLVPVLTVLENVSLPAVLDGTSESGARERAESLLAQLGLDEESSKLPAQLSGGEQQRAAIARALINEPAVVLADEPTGNLDRTSGAEVMALLRDVNERGQTLVLVTHDPAVAAHARRVVFMRDGKLEDEIAVTGRGSPRPILAKLAALEG
jgi:putative ABC transport system ATP-binding protein